MRIKRKIVNDWVPVLTFMFMNRTIKVYDYPEYALDDGHHVYKITEQQFNTFYRRCMPYENITKRDMCLEKAEQATDQQVKKFFLNAAKGFDDRLHSKHSESCKLFH